MHDLNIIQLRGRLGKDAETESTQSGKKVTSLSIATTPRYLDAKKGWKDGKTEWHRCYAWEKLAEKAATLKKGERVQVEGTLTSREYEKDGIKRQVWEVRITDLVRIAAFEKDAGEAEPADGYQTDEEIPFAAWTAAANMEPEAEILAEAMCKAAEEISHRKITAFRKVRDTVIRAALAASVYRANSSGFNWQKRVAVSALSALGAVGVLSSYVGKQRGR